MGNWMTVHIIGTCDVSDVPALRNDLDPGADYSNFHPLCNTRGLCGLGDWAATKIDRIGNLAERDYSVESVAETLGKLAWAAPSLAVKIHCGGDYESTKCVATITLKGKEVTIGDPEVEDTGEISTEQIKNNLRSVLGM